MGIKDFLNKTKKEYMKIQPSREFKIHGWNEIDLPEHERTTPLNYIFRRGIIISAAVAVFLTFGLFSIIQAAQASLPGEPLYPVKRLYEKVILANPTQKQEIIERRANEIIEAVNRKKGNQVLEESVKEYKKTIDDAKSDSANSEGKDLRRSLERHGKSFRETAETHPESKENLNEAVRDIEAKINEGDGNHQDNSGKN